MKKIKMYLVTLISIILLIYILVVVAIYFSQRKLLYHPSENNYLEENNLNHKIEKVFINSDTELVAWYYKNNNSNKTLLFFHGNAGKLDNRVYKLNEISKLDINYLIVAYRGFSGNKGKPTEKGLYKDAEAAKNWLNLKGIKDKNIILYGESLGTAIAVNLAKDNKFSGLILESPFTSMVSLAQMYYPYIPVKFLLKDKYESVKKLHLVKCPILIMHGKEDQIVPFKMGVKMFESSNTPKYKYFNDSDDHMMDFNFELKENLKNFLKSLN